MVASVRQNKGFRSRNRRLYDALEGPAASVHAVNVRFPNRKVPREQSQARQSLPRSRYPDRSATGGGGQDFGVAEHAFGRRLRALSENQEFSLARQRQALSRLSSDARRAA